MYNFVLKKVQKQQTTLKKNLLFMSAKSQKT